MARSQVHSVVVRWPNFTDPSATTHEDLSFAIPGIEALTAYSISLHDVSSALHWMKTLDSFPFPHSLGTESSWVALALNFHRPLCVRQEGYCRGLRIAAEVLGRSAMP